MSERTTRFRVLRGRGNPRGSPVASPDAMTDRLASLERQVEDALAENPLGPTEIGERLVRVGVDEALATWATLRRLALPDGEHPGNGVSGLTDLALQGLYRNWWRVEAVGLERLPARGRVLLVANRAGVLPYEVLMIALAISGAVRPVATVRPLVDGWILGLPFVGTALARGGAARASATHMRRLLEREEAVIACPEGTAALPRTFDGRYRLTTFGKGGFARVAIATGTPVVPVAVIGAEEAHPVLARLELPPRLGLPRIPITPTFPWLGLGGLMPLPTKWTIHVGEPIEIRTRGADGAGETRALRDLVHDRLQRLVIEGLRRRRSIFLG